MILKRQLNTGRNWAQLRELRSWCQNPALLGDGQHLGTGYRGQVSPLTGVTIEKDFVDDVQMALRHQYRLVSAFSDEAIPWRAVRALAARFATPKAILSELPIKDLYRGWLNRRGELTPEQRRREDKEIEDHKRSIAHNFSLKGRPSEGFDSVEDEMRAAEILKNPKSIGIQHFSNILLANGAYNFHCVGGWVNMQNIAGGVWFASALDRTDCLQPGELYADHLLGILGIPMSKGAFGKLAPEDQAMHERDPSFDLAALPNSALTDIRGRRWLCELEVQYQAEVQAARAA